jgi:hypothetical protein
MRVGFWGYLKIGFLKYKKQLPTLSQSCMILVRVCAIVVLFIGKPPCLTQAHTRMVQVWYNNETWALENKRCLSGKAENTIRP